MFWLTPQRDKKQTKQAKQTSFLRLRYGFLMFLPFFIVAYHKKGYIITMLPQDEN